MRHTYGNTAHAAGMFGTGRKSLFNKVKKYGLEDDYIKHLCTGYEGGVS